MEKIANFVASSASEYWRNAEEKRFVRQVRSSSSWTEHAADTRRTLMLEMDAVTLLLCSLRTRYNAVAHINRLSSEILAHIFSFLQKIDKPREVKLNAPGDQIGWLRATHICRQWRSAAIDHAYLWSNILVDLGRRWMEEFLHRSRMAPILFNDLETRRSDPEGARSVEDVASIIAQHLCHMQELSTVADDHQSAASIFLSLRQTAPVLEEFELYNKSATVDGDHNILPVTDPLPSLPPDLFDHVAPRLYYLSLWYFQVPWPSLVFSNLLYLRIMGTAGSAEAARFAQSNFETQDLRSFLDALSRMPALQVLELSFALPRLPPGARPRTSYASPVALTQLYRLYLKDTILECAVALNHMVLPPNVDKFVDCRLDTAKRRGADLIAPWIGSQMGTICDCKVQEWIGGFRIIAPSTFSVEASPEEGGLDIYIRYDDLEADKALDELRPICQILPLEHLESLCVDITYACQKARDWFSILGRCENLKHLEIWEHCQDSIWTALGSTLDSPVGGYSGSGRLFPSLLSLKLSDFELTPSDFHAKLLPMLKFRKTLMPLQWVDVSACGRVEHAIFSGIRDEVPEVIW
ncbi:hypothetical protein EVG20_g8250 [Dentipellis fragilis]|uniref:F-box domain-containing protein n=1 Tax=Dentipellis fragilis TaxID=205917 RepID=A0A4Y9YBF2_9AGAM|nr:hypothetical protein EVG20_g8250 [Dentipellis fragilis]